MRLELGGEPGPLGGFVDKPGYITCSYLVSNVLHNRCSLSGDGQVGITRCQDSEPAMSSLHCRRLWGEATTSYEKHGGGGIQYNGQEPDLGECWSGVG